MSEILVTENITGEAMTRLRESHDVAFEPDLWQDVERLAEQLKTARAIIVRNQTKLTRELMTAAPNLQIIGRAGAGLDNIDTAAASDTGIVVSYTPSENSVSVAELVLSFMLTAVRRIPAAWEDTRSGGWNRMQFVGGELFGKTLGIVGFGRIGRLVAERAQAFGMTIIAHDEFIDPTSPFVVERGIRLISLDDLLTEADFVSLHVPLTPETRNSFSHDAFQKMKSSAWFMNASRGEVVDEAALLHALSGNQIAGAALDVRSQEPPVDIELAKLDNVILTPHIGAFTHEAQERVVAAVCDDVAAVLSGNAATNAFNFPMPQK
ncbi:MAG: hydroxyacid dehydrogenase [Planctomycetota bacterium]|nr:hydroxyacid dehydrogenase [Planctomycetota bacterium]MDA0918131.1 hydroxyacid dehydrogenase [Planctomycetota bacterium]